MFNQNDGSVLFLKFEDKLGYFVYGEVGKSRTGLIKHDGFRLCDEHTGDLQSSQISEGYVGSLLVGNFRKTGLMDYSLYPVFNLFGMRLVEI